jgi:hypothetical protein
MGRKLVVRSPPTSIMLIPAIRLLTKPVYAGFMSVWRGVGSVRSSTFAYTKVSL